MILTPEELRQRLLKTDRRWKFTDAEMLTAVMHLATHGYVTRLKTSRGEPRVGLRRNRSKMGGILRVGGSQE